MDLAKIENGHIVVRIPIKDISSAASEGLNYVGCDYGDEMDYDDLATDIVSELNSESEDGSTLVNYMLDEAVKNGSENGLKAFAYLDE